MRKDRLSFVNAVNGFVIEAEQGIYQATGMRIRLLVVGELPPDERDATGMANVIASALGLTMLDYKSHSRRPVYLHLRHLAAFFIRQYYPGLSLNEIMDVTGHGDHTTVMHAIKAAKKMLETNDAIFQPKYEQALQAVTQWIKE